MSDSVTDILAQLQKGFLTPPRVSSLTHNWQAALIYATTPASETTLRTFVADHLEAISAAVSLPYLSELVEYALDHVQRRDFDLGALMPAPVQQDGLANGDLIPAAEVGRLARIIFTHMNEISAMMDELTHYLRVLRRAETYLTAAQRALTALVCDRTQVLPELLPHLSERQRLAATYLTDLQSDVDMLAQLKADVTTGLATLKGRLTLLLRADSSLRMLVGANSQEHAGNRSQSHPKTTPMTDDELEGFEIVRN